jgi:hypothetical protein
VTKPMNWLVLSLVVGCAKPGDAPCTPTRTDRGDGTTMAACGASRVLICTNSDCSGIADLSIAGTDLTSVSLDALTRGHVVVGDNIALAKVALPVLTSGEVSVTGAGALTLLELPAFATGNVFVGGTASLASLSLPAFTIGGVYVTDTWPSEATLPFPSAGPRRSWPSSSPSTSRRSPATTPARPARSSLAVRGFSSAPRST